MNAYEKSIELGLSGTDEEIVAALQSIQLHRKDAYITGGPGDTTAVNLLHLLCIRYGVMDMEPGQQWSGSLIELEATNPVVSSIMRKLRPMLQLNDSLVYCGSSVDAASMLNALTAIVGQLSGKPEQVVSDVALLSGGCIGSDYVSLTPELYAVARDESLQRIQADADAETARIAVIQAAAIRSARVSSIAKLDAESLVDASEDIDTAIDSIRASLVAFGGW